MNVDKLARYCELKTMVKQSEDELERLRKEIASEFAQDAEFKLGEYTLKIVYQEKRQYNDRLLAEALPDPELWRALFKADPAKISALVKTGLLSEKSLEGTYTTFRTPYLYVTSEIRGPQA
ncbi:hypothetical protein ACF3MZ_16405 [Paenibacillaceae bacterium WGS1546]|uniref:hypothetical protein n=1 Tax=Cohnella sp. WGS1546 TaxID=3366810 RepID=UPI00372D86F4